MFTWLMHVQQQSEIDNTRRSVRAVEREGISSQGQLEDLRSRVDALALASAAMWEIFAARLGLRQDDLERKMQEIDLRDGVADGRIGAPKTTCPGCGRTVHANRLRCLYCGASTPAAKPFPGQ